MTDLIFTYASSLMTIVSAIIAVCAGGYAVIVLVRRRGRLPPPITILLAFATAVFTFLIQTISFVLEAILTSGTPYQPTAGQCNECGGGPGGLGPIGAALWYLMGLAYGLGCIAFVLITIVLVVGVVNMLTHRTPSYNPIFPPIFPSSVPRLQQTMAIWNRKIIVCAATNDSLSVLPAVVQALRSQLGATRVDVLPPDPYSSGLLDAVAVSALDQPSLCRMLAVSIEGLPSCPGWDGL